MTRCRLRSQMWGLLNASPFFIVINLILTPVTTVASTPAFETDFFPGSSFGTLTFLESTDEPLLLTFDPEPIEPLFFITLRNLTSDIVQGMTIRVGEVNDGLFSPSAGSTIFAFALGLSVSDQRDSYSSLNATSTIAEIDFATAYEMGGPPGPMPPGLSPGGVPVILDFLLLAGLPGPLSTGPLAFSIDVEFVPVPEPAASTLAMVTAVYVLGRRRSGRV